MNNIDPETQAAVPSPAHVKREPSEARLRANRLNAQKTPSPPARPNVVSPASSMGIH